jgi:flagellar biosynthesis/type III secretory pathway protein FliH
MSGGAEDFRRSYASAFEKYLRDPAEDALHSGYQLGREAVRQDLSVLDLASIHHDVLLATLSHSSPPSETATVVPRARTFFVESLSAFEMVQRGFREAHEAALVEKRNAAILRQLSNFLADASLALNATESLTEMLQLVAEQARELIGAECAVARHRRRR